MMSNVNQQRNVTRTTSLNSAEAALSQTRINEFLSDNANKDKTRPSTPSSSNAEKTLNPSPQVEKVPLLNESVSEAEGTAKVAWSFVKSNTTSNSPVDSQNPSNSSDIASTFEVKREKNYKKKKRKRREKRKDLAAMALANHDYESSDYSFG